MSLRYLVHVWLVSIGSTSVSSEVLQCVYCMEALATGADCLGIQRHSWYLSTIAYIQVAWLSLQVLTPADDIHHINKHNFKVPFVCGCRDLGEALRRIVEGAAMIRTKGEAGTGNVVEAVRHTRSLTGAIRQLQTLDDDELYVYAKEIRAPVDLVRKTKHLGRSVLP